MSREPRLACKFAALALAMNARVGPVYRTEVADLVLRAVLLAEGDVLRDACITFAREVIGGLESPGRVARAGEALQRDVERAGWPDIDPRAGAN
jgi:hypothetical protein